MKRFNLLICTGISAALLLSSCDKESSDITSELQVKMQASNKTNPILKSASSSAVTPIFVWDICTMNVTKIEFEAEGSESVNAQTTHKVSYEWRGSKTVDLFSSAAVIGSIQLDPGIYEEIELQVKASKSENSTSPAFYLSGSYVNALGIEIPVEVLVNENLEFEVEQEGATLDGVNDYSALIDLNLSLLMNNILQSELDLAQLLDGKIVISSTSNSALYLKIKSNFSLLGKVEYDHHGDDHDDDDD
jgi:hypothetical protein